MWSVCLFLVPALLTCLELGPLVGYTDNVHFENGVSGLGVGVFGFGVWVLWFFEMVTLGLSRNPLIELFIVRQKFIFRRTNARLTA